MSRLITRLVQLAPRRALCSSSSSNNNSNNNSSSSAKSWRLTRLNHVALVVPDLEAATKLFATAFGAKVTPKQVLPEHGVSTVFVELDNCKLELLHPLNEESPVANFLTKNKSGGIHHICIETDNIQGAIKDLPQQGVRTLGTEAKTGAHGYPVMFLHPKDVNGVLTELEQPDEEWKKKHG